MEPAVIVFDDQANTIGGLKRKLLDVGLKPEISTTENSFKRRLQAPPEHHCGWLIDNHIEKCRTLEAFGEPKVHTENGSLAGYRIISNILIPRMRSGAIPKRPIGLMSRRSLERAKSLYENEFSNNEPVFFFQKPESPGYQERDVQRYFEALERCRSEQSSNLGREGVAVRMVERFRNWADLSGPELDSIFRCEKGYSLSAQIQDGEIKFGTGFWLEMAVLLSKVEIALTQVFAHSANPSSDARAWLRRAKIGSSGETPMELLQAGKFEFAYTVLDAATFARELR